jgi:hypothetical protein
MNPLQQAAVGGQKLALQALEKFVAFFDLAAAQMIV